ncbi:protein of unknown function [Shewanella benthica]|uniref:Uncharacterized protein n=1 Tax=Shewanella benthica TaxID=43661 RepID=A0A330ME59_9GAMM|nr:protein of unknown function [Shewanella benthica]
MLCRKQGARVEDSGALTSERISTVNNGKIWHNIAHKKASKCLS